MAKKPSPTLQLIAGTDDQLPVGQLLFDDQNPRLATDGGDRSQDSLVKVLWEEMAVDEIAYSIQKNGFFPQERLFVIPGRPRAGSPTYVVVEGNRRLAAVKLLLDEDLRAFVGATDLPKIAADRRGELQTLPVTKYPNRENLWQYFGFRHINGPKPWDSFSKAVYVTEVHEEYGVALPLIADTIGDRHDTVRRLYRGYLLLRQSESQAGFDRERRTRKRFAFSHLYTAADSSEFQRFLGIAADDLDPNPVPRKNLAELRELMVWLYGDRAAEKEPLIESQNPDLNRLREVIKTQRGVDALRAGYPLLRAYEISIGDEVRFREGLVRAKEELQQTSGLVTTGYRGEPDLMHTMDSIRDVAEAMHSAMLHKARKSATKGSRRS